MKKNLEKELEEQYNVPLDEIRRDNFWFWLRIRYPDLPLHISIVSAILSVIVMLISISSLILRR